MSEIPPLRPSKEIPRLGCLARADTNGSISIWLDCHGTVNCGDAAFDVVEDSVGLQPVLYITEKFRQNSDKTYASLVLFHEFVHYRQFLSNPTDFSHGCEMIWEREKEANVLECVLALKLGVTNAYEGYTPNFCW